MKLALAQLNPPAETTEETQEHVAQLANAAAAGGADVLVLPELLFPGYHRPERHRAEAQAMSGPWVQHISATAQQTSIAIVFGWAERDGDKVYNAASAIAADGSCTAHYRKLQLFGPMEHQSFEAGSAIPPIFTLGDLKCGLLICYDIEFPEHTRSLARRGAQLILVPTANPTGYELVQDLLVPARAAENAVTVAYANYIGTDHGLDFGGGSLIAGPDGRVLAKAGLEEALFIVEIPSHSDWPEGALSRQIEDLNLPE